MEEEGIVVEVKGGIAKVEIVRSRVCGGCHACTIGARGRMVTEAENLVGAKKGERVKVEIPTPLLLKAVFMVYLLPLLGLVSGCVVGKWAAELLGFKASEIIGAMVGVWMLGLGFWITHRYDKRMRKKGEFKSRVVKIKGEREVEAHEKVYGS